MNIENCKNFISDLRKIESGEIKWNWDFDEVISEDVDTTSLRYPEIKSCGCAMGFYWTQSGRPRMGMRLYSTLLAEHLGVTGVPFHDIFHIISLDDDRVTAYGVPPEDVTAGMVADALENYVRQQEKDVIVYEIDIIPQTV